ncbi:MAG: HD-GYP domain-containing protein [Alkalibacterium sp.]|uniref:HDIG domain-containing protein n=1 Tax=Alkalibacterium gilvum TaxID=1130080 RepID=A0A1H6U9E4_9LACT|nr:MULTISPECIES: HD-GYP domain-containing protein [Alkalibacterium]MDN6293297.1 HD-GYP domain-containing protein [Alkalibacterium sp.]MDN6295914.1 HD-GYP domain-containing protein [Alkalibacterium sp.]MDN6398621.1 HD-GYP domain-containing protein [Alkalibacterium sp.]SEI88988.1 HDIG domain-containing protein [Alkalibacterium gilvum]
MNEPLTEKKQIMDELIQAYDQNLNSQILNIASIYIILSISWTLVFRWFHIPFSRADLGILLLIFLVLSLVFLIFRFAHTSTKVNTHIVLQSVVFVIISLYFGSGYSEAWSYFLLVPIVTSLYGKRFLSIFYSTIGLLSMIFVRIGFPDNAAHITDAIDISNRILLYIIVATFSYLVLSKLNMLYDKQVNTVVESMETTLEQVVQSFIVAMEAKDLYTFGHSERVSQYAVALAKQLPEYQHKQKLSHLRLSGLLHDIGKINMPESILTKPTALTSEEYEVIKTHTSLGGQMVEKVDGLQGLKNGVLYHHERWDGKGYPTGSVKKDIPLEARILAVADSFDAMTTTRAYRSGIDLEEAFKRIYDGLGSQFDPNLKEAIEAAESEFIKIYFESHDPLEEFEKLTDFL